MPIFRYSPVHRRRWPNFSSPSPEPLLASVRGKYMDYQDWRDQKDRWKEDKRRWREEGRSLLRQRIRGGPHCFGRGLIGLIFIAAGALFLLSNLGFYYIDNLWDYWPVILVVLGASNAISARHPSGWISGGILMTVGGILLGRNLGYIHGSVWQFFWPFILIMVGASMLLRNRPWGRPPVSVSGTINASTIDEYVVFGGVKRRVDSQDFEGGEAFALFGGVEIDLRKAATTKDEMRIDANAIFGGIEIRVPENWQVVTRGAGIFGGYEDKSTPMPSPDGKLPRLLITGQAVFGGVNIRN
jgi:predicted membrane protein